MIWAGGSHICCICFSWFAMNHRFHRGNVFSQTWSCSTPWASASVWHRSCHEAQKPRSIYQNLQWWYVAVGDTNSNCYHADIGITNITHQSYEYFCWYYCYWGRQILLLLSLLWQYYYFCYWCHPLPLRATQLPSTRTLTRQQLLPKLSRLRWQTCRFFWQMGLGQKTYPKKFENSVFTYPAYPYTG